MKTFEAAVRRGTTVAAAAELGVTHGAVSRQLQQLEEWLGRPLFRREGGRLIVTQAGADYGLIAGRALDLLHDGTQELLEISDTTVRINTTASFASEWLMPRLDDFRALHPQIEIWIEEAKDIVDPRSGGCDLAIRMGQGGWAGVQAEPLMDDRLFPVCAPEIAAELTSIDALSKARLLHDDDPQAQWGRWLAEAGVSSSSEMAGASGRGPRFASSALLMKAAAAGHGVALARERLAGAWLANGTLVRPFSQAVALGPAYWLVTRHGVEPRRPLRIFVAWLKRQAVPASP